MFCGSVISDKPGPKPETTSVSFRATSFRSAPAGVAAASGAGASAPKISSALATRHGTSAPGLMRTEFAVGLFRMVELPPSVVAPSAWPNTLPPAGAGAWLPTASSLSSRSAPEGRAERLGREDGLAGDQREHRREGTQLVA